MSTPLNLEAQTEPATKDVACYTEILPTHAKGVELAEKDTGYDQTGESGHGDELSDSSVLITSDTTLILCVDEEKSTLSQHYSSFNDGSFDNSVASPNDSIGLLNKVNPVQENTQEDSLKTKEIKRRGEESLTINQAVWSKEYENDLGNGNS